MDINVSDLIQIVIAVIMCVSVYLSYRSIQNNSDLNKTQFFTNLCRDERIIQSTLSKRKGIISKQKDLRVKEKLENESDEYLFDFYEYVAILVLRNKVNLDLFLDYFGSLIGVTYAKFMESKLFKDHKERVVFYPKLCKLFNRMDLSIEKRSENSK